MPNLLAVTRKTLMRNKVQDVLALVRRIPARVRIAFTMCFIASFTVAADPRGCTDQEIASNAQVICAAIKRSPHYHGGKLDAIGERELHKWVRKTNFTLDRLHCAL